MSRDNARTPVQWSSEKNAGFTSGTPWLRVNTNYKEMNVESQEMDKNSILNYYRKLISIRKSPEYSEVFTYGMFVPAYTDYDNIMAYYREDDKKRILVAANFGKCSITLPLEYPVKCVALSNQNKTNNMRQVLVLESCEVVVIECGR